MENSAFRLTTERLTVSPLGLCHLPQVHACLSDREHTALMVFNPKESIDETLELINRAISQEKLTNPRFLEFAVTCKDRFVGNLTLYFFPEDPTTAELAWVISREHTGKGYAFEAVSALMEHFAKARGITRFIALCDSENAPSVRLAQKLGMELTGSTGGRYNRSAPDRERTELTFQRLF